MTDTDAPILDTLSRRGFLRGAALAGGGIVATTLAACAPAAGALPAWTYGPATAKPANPDPTAAPAAPAAGGHHHSPAPSDGNHDAHDANALAVVKRFLGGEYGQVDGAG